MSKLNMNLFAFTSWLVRNRHAETEDKLRIIDGYDWYNYMWNKYLENTDVGKQIKNVESITMVEAWMGLSTSNEGEKSTGENNNPDTTNNTVTTKQNNTGTYPVPGQTWQHYKGGRYEITAMCNHTDTNEVLVIYRSLSFGGFHARPYSEWHDEIWDGDYCLGKRFKLIK
jgi:hypothetical protein